MESVVGALARLDPIRVFRIQTEASAPVVKDHAGLRDHDAAAEGCVNALDQQLSGVHRSERNAG